MINPFTISGNIAAIQREVLAPLYGDHSQQKEKEFDALLVSTGEAIANHQVFFEEVSRSSLVAIVFKIIKLFGGADGLTDDDFARFTSYIRDGGLKAMITMLLAEDKEKTFINELTRLKPHIRNNAAPMLEKSKELHRDFIQGYLSETYGAFEKAPEIIKTNFFSADKFISRLAELASQAK